MELPKGEFVRHAACPGCGSSDGLAIYSSNTSYCYVCKKYFDGKEAMEKSTNTIPPGEFKSLATRKLTKATCQFFGYSVGAYSGKPVQIAPYYKHRKLAAQHIRFPNKEFIWTGTFKGVELFGQHLFSPGGKNLIITEGEIDCMSVAQCFNLKWAVVSIPSGVKQAKQAITENLEFVNSFQTVIFAFDNDEPGKEALEECAPLVTPGKAKVLTYNGYKDANEYLQDGKAQELIQAIFNAVPYRPDGILSGQDLWESFNEEEPIGFSTPYPILDSLTYGMRKGELVMYTAGSGIGKSTLVHEIGYSLLVDHGQSIGILALEENKRRIAKRYPSIYLNKPLHLPGVMATVPENTRKQAFDATTGSGKFWVYDHWGSKDIDTISAKLRYMAVGCGCDFIILDHISIVVSGLDEVAESERKMIDKLMTALTSLISETGVGIHAIVHLKRPMQGKSFNEGREVVLTDLRGSGSLEQLSFVVVALNRNQMSDDPDESWIRVLKNRPIGTLGVADTLQYSHETGRLLPKTPFPIASQKEDF